MSILRFQNRQFAALLILCMLLTTLLLPAKPTQAITSPATVELIAVADARVQGGSPDNGFGNGFIWVGTANGHLAYVQFDLLALPANATITSAELHLRFTGAYSPTANVEVGRADGPWDEATITWNTRPANTFNSNTQTITDTAADVVWPVTGIVSQWHSGTQPNYGFALRGDGPLKSFYSRETSAGDPPRLVITYTTPPEEGPRPDFGDAPDSSNSLGITPNTAYAGVPGNFPTVWNGTPAGQAAGPRHANPGLQGILGQYLSREVEADTGNDADTVNNILNGGANNADNDRGDDGWRNRLATFEHCEQTTLRIRVSKAQNATIQRMFLNVWFDGNRDGDWGDRALCTPQGEALAIPAYEWIVQDYYVDMTGIPAGGYVDIDVNTVAVLNTTEEQRHWMRFTLSDERAPQSANGRADGRGPHPNATPSQYQFGETEDVLQRPQLPGEDGTLEIQKRVVNIPGNSLPIGGLATYEIRLRHIGGTQPIQVQIRDELTQGFRIFPQIVSGQLKYVLAESATGGAAPLLAGYELEPGSPTQPFPIFVMKWQGSLMPDSEITLSFLVQNLGLCETNQPTQEVVNIAQARPRGGAVISDTATFAATCPNYNPFDIEVEPNTIDDDILVDDLNSFPWSGEIWNRHTFPVSIGVYLPGTSTITQDDTTTVLSLEPNERRDIQIDIPLDQNADELDQPFDDPISISVGFCFIFPNSPTCPDAVEFPHYHGESTPITITLRPNDLGDAPDSSNHAGVPMLAYPGTPANYPTVFDPATGLPQGPRHARPRPLHLGERVSREGEADIGPDQDPLNNIVPAANDPNNDRGDDGVRLDQWALVHCQTTTIPVKIFVSPQAVAWFQQQGTPAYINAWVDANRDGDWADNTGCGGGVDGGGPPAVEHIVIDAPINVVALGAGLHTVNVPTGLVPWPAQLADQPAWVRVSLSEVPSNKTLQVGNLQYGDGRGFALAFRTGETEDYLLRSQAEPDLGVELNGRIIPGGRDGNPDTISFKLEYGNFGDQTAEGSMLVFTKPAQLRDHEIVLWQAPGISAADITETQDAVTIKLPDVAPGASNAIVLQWEAPADQQPAGDYTGAVEVQVDDDADTANNTDDIELERPLRRPNVAALAGNDNVWGFRETTCRTDVMLVGLANPALGMDLLVDGTTLFSFFNSDEVWQSRLEDLTPGRHEIRVAPIGTGGATIRSRPLILNVDPSLPIDPISLTFTDSQGVVYHPSTLHWGSLLNQVNAVLQSGETYEIGIDTCIEAPNQQYDLLLPNGDPISMTDLDGDGRYTGSFVFDESGSINAQENGTNELRLIAGVGGTRRSFPLSVEPQPAGMVLDAVSGQPLNNATVSILSDDNGIWPAAALGRNNPQTTGTDGSYNPGDFSGAFRLLITRNGYQPYRSRVFDESGSIDAASFQLMPQINGPATHIVSITENGFVPAVVKVAPGDVIEWVNLDLREHTVTGSRFDSGALAPGERYRFQVADTGIVNYYDAEFPASTAQIDGRPRGGGLRAFLPVIIR